MKQKVGLSIRRGLNLLAALSILCSLLPLSVAAASPPAATEAPTAPTTPPAGDDGHPAAHEDETVVSLSYLTEQDVQQTSVGPLPGAPEMLALAGPTDPGELTGPRPPVTATLDRTPSLLAGPPEWGPNMQLSPRRDVWAPAITFDDAGDAHVVWEQDEFYIVYVWRRASSRSFMPNHGSDSHATPSLSPSKP